MTKALAKPLSDLLPTITEDQFREFLKGHFQTISIRKWCRLHNVHNSDVSAFLRGKKGPRSGLLRAFNYNVSDMWKDRAIKQFWAQVDRSDATGCWGWLGPHHSGGYGRFTSRYINGLAHRLVLILSGVEVPENKVVDHMCRNHGCINPDHLRLVTKRENSIFNSNSVSAKNAAKTHCKYGHPLSGDNLRTWTPRGKSNVRRKCRACENRASLARLSPEGGSAS